MNVNIMSRDCDDFNDMMDIADSEQFTQQFLSQFHSIEWQTIDSLIENGYRNREELMAFDLKEDLPLLPNVSMAQKSLLRKALQLLLSDEELERKINDIKADNVVELKRKRKVSESPIAAKRSRNTDSVMSDFDGSRLSGRYATARKSITGKAPRRQLPVRVVQEVPAVFEFRTTRSNKSNTMNGNLISYTSNEDNDDDSEEIDDEEVEEVVVNRQTQRVTVSNSYPKFGLINATIKPEPIDTNDRRRSVRSPLVSPTTTIKTTTPKAKFDKPANTVPTPTEIELREHLAKQKALGKPKPRRSIRN